MLPPGVVFAADAGHHIQEVYVAAAVGVAVALAVWEGKRRKVDASLLGHPCHAQPLPWHWPCSTCGTSAEK